jgi:hypothetical protein
LFDQFPNRRITERRESLKSAAIALISLIAGGSDVFRKGRLDWGTLGWAFVFILSLHSYWKGRHEDPWNPPDLDGKQRHYGALERTDASPTEPGPTKH